MRSAIQSRSPAVRTVLLLVLALPVLLALAVRPAAALETQARQAILVDMTTDTVLFEKNADERMPPSSMSKIMTMYMVFDAIEQGRMSLDDILPVSEHAWRTGGAVTEGSTSFLPINSRAKVEDLARGVIVQSGNDASIVLAEGLAGSEEAFARQMTQRAHELGMSNSSFMNATGLPDPQHYTTARDLATLAEHVIKDHPSSYHYYSELDFTFNGHKQGNRNTLLYRNIGVDGLKTGHTEAAGYGLTASALRNGRRLILVVNGLPSTRARTEESERLIEWGFREFDMVRLFRAGEAVETAAVWMGNPDRVPLVPAEDVAASLRRGGREQMRVSVRVQEPVPAPIRQGDRIGTLVLQAPDMPVREVPLLAGIDVERKGFFGRVASGAGHLLFGGL